VFNQETKKEGTISIFNRGKSSWGKRLGERKEKIGRLNPKRTGAGGFETKGKRKGERKDARGEARIA